MGAGGGSKLDPALGPRLEAGGRAGGAAIEPSAPVGSPRAGGEEPRQKLVQSGEASAAYSVERGVLAPVGAPKMPAAERHGELD